MKKKLIKIKNTKIKIDKLYFQYNPKSFIKRFYPGEKDTMLRVDNSPHFKFLKLYQNKGKGIWDCYKETDYIKLMIAWNRHDKHNRWKVKRFITNYESIKKKGVSSRITVLEKPLYKKLFKSGYEIYHGHHRASICAALGIDIVRCVLSKVK